MADLPRITNNDFVERTGIIAVQTAINEARCIWRELLQRDIGIDGHIEYVTEDGFAPGRLVSIQVRAGASIFSKATPTHVPFTPDSKHRDYWAEYPLPVILVLHDPATGETVWTDARHDLRSYGRILVPRSNRFDAHGVLQALQCSGPLPTGGFDAAQIVERMASAHDTPQGLCFLYLFAQGITDVGSSIYFGMDLMSEVLDFRAAAQDMPSFGVGESEFSFIDDYVAFLIAEDLARVDFASWKQAIDERHMVGTFIAPLTAKGRAIKDEIARLDDEIYSDRVKHGRVIQERPIRMLINQYLFDEFGARQAQLESLRAALANRLS